MNKKVYKLTYMYAENDYKIEPVTTNSSIDKSKVTDRIKRFSQHIWTCRDIDKLREFAEQLHKEQIERLERNLDKAKKCTISIVR